MLTKDLVRVRNVKGYLRPQFVKVDDPQLQELAEELLAIYALEGQPTRAEIDQAVAPLFDGAVELKLAKGLNKLLQDRCEFSQPQERDYATDRMAAFKVAARLLAPDGPADFEDFQERLAQEADREFLAGDIYADLPENERLVAGDLPTATELLDRYNLALVQALLFDADRLELLVHSPDPAQIRRLMHFLRFFRLLARVEPYGAPEVRDPASGALHLQIDGPASIVDSARKYGLQLAQFFPAVCALERWQLHATVKRGTGSAKLALSERQGLVCPYRHVGAYTPPEVKAFAQQFRAEASGWQLVQGGFLHAGGQTLIFPDFSFRHDSGQEAHLEVFHRWHAGPLHERLELLATEPHLPLLIAVDRALHRREETAAALEASHAFTRRGFLFNDFPSVTKAREALDRLREESCPGLPGL